VRCHQGQALDIANRTASKSKWRAEESAVYAVTSSSATVSYFFVS
jgi:hypothetical protein